MGSAYRTLLIMQSFRPDCFFSAEQQQRLSDLMNLWRAARDDGQTLPPEQQAELDSLVEAELKAATTRTAALDSLGLVSLITPMSDRLQHWRS
jgi:hypothetical protein